MAGAMDGITVVEVGLLVQGPQAAALLGEWGAAVVKVELPGFGDQSRWLPVTPTDPRSAYFTGCNRGKRSVTMDLRRPEGRELFLQLVERADVVVSNFKPGTMEDWGLGYADVAARNPRVIYATGSTFGYEGEVARREGADLAAQAFGGVIATTGSDGSHPTTIGVTICDHVASLNLAAGISAALFARERTGQGQWVRTSLVGAQVWAQASEYQGALFSGVHQGPANQGHPLIPGLYGIFSTADGWLAVVGVAGPLRHTLFETLGHPEYTERFPQPLYWPEQKAELFPLLNAAFATRTTAEWCEVLGGIGVRHAPVRTYVENIADPVFWEQGFLTHAEGPDGPVAVPASPVGFSATPAVPQAVAPELGQHTEEVLLELGHDWERIAELRDAGVV